MMYQGKFKQSSKGPTLRWDLHTKNNFFTKLYINDWSFSSKHKMSNKLNILVTSRPRDLPPHEPHDYELCEEVEHLHGGYEREPWGRRLGIIGHWHGHGHGHWQVHGHGHGHEHENGHGHGAACTLTSEEAKVATNGAELILQLGCLVLGNNNNCGFHIGILNKSFPLWSYQRSESRWRFWRWHVCFCIQTL